ncbi:MAG TPA: SigE family RNA polymerase sigma factor [Arachnia sp.]|nr:SigE family RNA polymerase sigma factor [Arachnia sp.]HMT85867.1 SigE family RNA polymerase sigma factor [Arachnia sp.]
MHSGPTGFDNFVRQRGRALWRAAYLLTGDSHKAGDLVQTVLAKTYSHYRGDDGAFEAYVRTALYRTYVSWWRRRWNGELPSEALPEFPEAEHGSRSERLDLLRALAELPKAQRAVLVLRYFEDCTVAEVAERLGMSEGTVKSHSFRAREALRRSSHLKEEAR